MKKLNVKKVLAVLLMLTLLSAFGLSASAAPQYAGADQWSFTVAGDDKWVYNDDGSITHNQGGASASFMEKLDLTKPLKIAFDFTYDQALCSATCERPQVGFALRGEIEEQFQVYLCGPYFPLEGNTSWMVDPAYLWKEIYIKWNEKIPNASVWFDKEGQSAHLSLDWNPAEKNLDITFSVGGTEVMKGNFYDSKMESYMQQTEVSFTLFNNAPDDVHFVLSNISIVNGGTEMVDQTKKPAQGTTATTTQKPTTTTTTTVEATPSTLAINGSTVTAPTDTEGGIPTLVWILAAVAVGIGGGVVVILLLLKKGKK